MKNILTEAIDEVIEQDGHLFSYGASEMSIVFRVARSLAKRVEKGGINVDVEYNLLGDELKRVFLEVDEELRQKFKESLSNVNIQTGSRRIFPDIVVHQRGSQRNNKMVVEVKCASTFEEGERKSEFDEFKLSKILAQLKYTHAFQVIFLRQVSGELNNDFKCEYKISEINKDSESV